MSQQPVPEAFRDLVNLAADETGTFVVWASDDYFAPKENLLRSDAPVWREGEYTDRGKWMDGWESQRKRGPGDDAAIIRLGTPGAVVGLLVDTTHFKGNAPLAVALDGCVASHTATADELLALAEGDDGWRTYLERTEIRPDFGNVIVLPAPSARVTHLRLRIFPDGGVSRLRVYGRVLPEPALFWQPAALDLAAIEHGGRVAVVSDAFFGPPANLLLPGRGVNMGDGWETRRRRTPGSDWCILELGRRGEVQRIEVDTHFFKGNAPQACSVLAWDAGPDAPPVDTVPSETIPIPLATDAAWWPVLDQAPLVQHRRHVFVPARRVVATHLQVHIFPHGGVNRMRVFGQALPTAAERARLRALEGLAPEARAVLWRSFCAAEAWVTAMESARSWTSPRALFAAAEDAFARLAADDWLQAFAAHPRIGAPKPAAAATALSSQWSAREQGGAVAAAAGGVLAALAAGNEAYFQRHGFLFICFASGRSAPQMLDILQRRLDNPREVEIRNAADEQIRITRLRLERWLQQG